MMETHAVELIEDRVSTEVVLRRVFQPLGDDPYRGE